MAAVLIIANTGINIIMTSMGISRLPPFPLPHGWPCLRKWFSWYYMACLVMMTVISVGQTYTNFYQFFLFFFFLLQSLHHYQHKILWHYNYHISFKFALPKLIKAWIKSKEWIWYLVTPKYKHSEHSQHFLATITLSIYSSWCFALMEPSKCW